MKRIYIYLIISIIGIQCNTLKQDKCNENIEFKNVFMMHVNNIELFTLRDKNPQRDHSEKANIEEGIKSKKFQEGLEFLEKYVNISYENIFNYSFEYRSIEVFKKDKANWLKWYEKNKCNNIQIR